jgi:hypothetical protein
MKQTAVEWLYEKLERMIPRTALYDIDKREYFQEAKEMEKQQIIDAFKSGDCNGTFETINAEQYYNDKFNK